MVVPGGADAALDGSWPAVLAYAHEQGWQFGKDVAFTWGPWGFLNNFYHLGDTAAVPKLLWESLGKLGIAAMLVWLTRRLPIVAQTAFVLCCVCFNWLFIDSIFLGLITLIVIGVLLKRETRPYEVLSWLLVLAFLGQMKFTYTMCGVVGVVAACWMRAAEKHWWHAALLALGFPVVYGALWWLSGQNPLNLPAYFRLSLEISSGYSDAMGFREPWHVFYSGAALASLCGVYVWHLARRPGDRAWRIATAAYLAFTWYASWKHGFVRADSHVFGFYVYTMLVACAVPSLCWPDQRWHWFNAAAIASIGCIQIFEPGLPARCPAVALARLRENTRHLIGIGSIPARWNGELAATAEQNSLPTISNIVGNQPVDVFNYEQGVALMDRLNYQPRPIFQSYSAYTPGLMETNLRHYQSGGAPPFILWQQITIDGRYPTMDDALLVPELFGAYTPVQKEGRHLLLSRTRPLRTRPYPRTLLLSRPLRIGESLTLPDIRNQAVWFQARLPLNKIGRLRSLLYKPPTIRLIVTDNMDRKTTWRILPRVAEAGFLLNPLLETNEDFSAFLRGQTRKYIKTLQFDVPRKEKEFWAQIWDLPEIALYVIPDIKLDGTRPYREWVETNAAEIEPIEIKAAVTPEPLSVDGGAAMTVHPPGQVTFHVPAGAGRLTGICGIRDDAYQGEGKSDGVEFSAVAELADGSTRVLWQRLLNPARSSGDRGPQAFSIELGSPSPRSITLSTRPGPENDSRWDWAYVAGLRFEPSKTR